MNQILGEDLSAWKSVAPPAKTLMQGSFCRLEPLNPNLHAESLFDVLQRRNEESSWLYLPYGPFEEFNDFCQWLHELNQEKDSLIYCIVDSAANSIQGLCGYLRITPLHGSIEVGHLHYSKLLKRSKIATEAMYLMMYRAFEELGYRRYEWKCSSLNLASRAAAERLGFKFEGIFRQDKVFKNHSRDTAWYSIIDKEWPECKKRLEQWLDVANFDANGQQIKKLREY
jgi:RimJ/RimL family protein N-acetyltransferase